mgnify:FL=1
MLFELENNSVFSTHTKLFRGRFISKLGCAKYKFCSPCRKAGV